MVTLEANMRAKIYLKKSRKKVAISVVDRLRLWAFGFHLFEFSFLSWKFATTKKFSAFKNWWECDTDLQVAASI
ncbi:hypothetical protein L3X38_014579 [Prunus dulcis]|uniref:Uncharacterized protein n=1 Tax=Prunus dulcis TaxID=3755 RepID=A0AAD4WNG0_PRUDU|nr:hypothetical protein L3X38_014579 [Prunus dulcis]